MSSNPQLNIDAVYVLSVQKFKDRIKHIENESRRIGINFEFIFKHDADKIEADIDSHFFGESPILAKPQRSLVLKHIEAWKYCLDNGHKRILVLEDDVIFHDLFMSKIRNLCAELEPLSSYLVYLGGADTKVPPEYFLATSSIIKNPIATTDGYITDYSACKKRLDWICNHKITMPSDYLLKKIDPMLNIDHYWSTEPLVEQGSVFGLFSTTLDSNRKRKSSFHNLIRYKFKILTRRVLPKIYYKSIAALGLYKK